jgi:hypothetical protein
VVASSSKKDAKKPLLPLFQFPPLRPDPSSTEIALLLALALVMVLAVGRDGT